LLLTEQINGSPREIIMEKLAKRITFGGGNFCGVVTDFFLVRVLQKFALDFFFTTPL
jgi:hypothetical protein